jgi:hypothetical protein
MARNGHAITTKAVNEPADLYDTLTQSDQDVFDRIGTLGYIPEQGNSGLWLAKKRADPKRIAVGRRSRAITALRSMICRNGCFRFSVTWSNGVTKGGRRSLRTAA